jgi:RNase P subunit RPR2
MSTVTSPPSARTVTSHAPAPKGGWVHSGQRKKAATQNDTQMRLNFLMQASTLMAQLPGVCAQRVSRSLTTTFKRTAQRTVQRLAPSVKHALCKQCVSLLLPGISATQRYHAHGGQSRIETACTNCGLTRRVLTERARRRAGASADTHTVATLPVASRAGPAPVNTTHGSMHLIPLNSQLPATPTTASVKNSP